MATQVGQKYKCNVCGNEVVVTNAGIGELVCCGQPMVTIGEGFVCK
jgi:desulfoferrodoxin-like iron-binding protein